MSWHIIVQDVPADAGTIHDIPDGFTPASLGLERRTIVTTAAAVAGTVRDGGSWWFEWVGDGFHIDFNLGRNAEATVDGFAMHSRTNAGRQIAERLVRDLGVTAFVVEDGTIIR